MKKFITALILSLGIVVAVPASGFAAGDLTLVSGTVRAGSTPVSGANVNVSCNSASRSTSSDSTGRYSVVFGASECPDNAIAKTTATKGGASGTNTGSVDDRTVVNVALVDVNVALPEMGTVIGGIAAIGGAGAFLVARKRQQDANRA